MGRIKTIGYESAQLEDFLETLLQAEVSTLIDVRDVAVSRRPGFSKKALAQALKSVGIDYLHLKALGDPKPGRAAAKRGDFDEFRRIFSAHIETQEAQEQLDAAASIAVEKQVCLLCYERDPLQCHRSIVARKISAKLASGEIQHLGVPSGIAEKPHRAARRAHAHSC